MVRAGGRSLETWTGPRKPLVSERLLSFMEYLPNFSNNMQGVDFMWPVCVWLEILSLLAGRNVAIPQSGIEFQYDVGHQTFEYVIIVHNLAGDLVHPQFRPWFICVHGEEY